MPERILFFKISFYDWLSSKFSHIMCIFFVSFIGMPSPTLPETENYGMIYNLQVIL